MRRLSKTWAVFAVLIAVPLSAGLSQDYESVQMTVIPLQGSVSMITGRGGNIGLSAGADGVLLIDDQFAPLSEKLKAAVAQVSDQPVSFVINTHWHGDHTGGNEALGRAGAVIVAHDKVRERLRDRPAAEDALPVVTFSETVTFHLNGEAIRVIKVPSAHTDGDAIVQFTGSDVLHLGDVFFNGLYSYFDGRSGGRFEGMIGALELALALAGPDTKIIPGHGALASRADLADHTERLIEIHRRSQAAIDQGISKQDFIASQPTADLAAAYVGDYQVMAAEKFLALVYDDLSR